MTVVLNWMPVMGIMGTKKDAIVFKGGKVPLSDEQEGSEIGLFICNRTFSEGTISVDIRFEAISEGSCGR